MLTLPDWKIVVHNILRGIIKIIMPEGIIKQQSRAPTHMISWGCIFKQNVDCGATTRALLLIILSSEKKQKHKAK